MSGDLFDGDLGERVIRSQSHDPGGWAPGMPYSDLFRTPHKGNTSHQYYVLNDYFELKNRQVSSFGNIFI
jgi:hypothetical protein